MPQYRSNFEKKVAADLKARGIRFKYEEFELEYFKDVYRGTCSNCGSSDVWTKRVYIPDFYLYDYGIHVEAKGKFVGMDRKKHIFVRRDHPELDIRLLFMRDNYMTKKKKTKYSEWCAKNSIICHTNVNGIIPEDWLNE